MTFWTLLKNELWKLLRRGRTYLGPAGLVAIVVPTAIGMKYGDLGPDIKHFVGSQMQLIGSPINALFLARMVLPPTVLVFLPLCMGLVAGDQISGEAADGTLRALLARPVPRVTLVLAKFTASAVYAVVVTWFLALAALLIGWALLGAGGLLSPMQMTFFGMREGLERLALAYAYVSLAMLPVCAVAFLLSVLVTNSLAPVVATLGFLMVSYAVEELPFFKTIRPWLLTTHLQNFGGAFSIPADIAELRAGAFVFVLWTAVCCGVSCLIFNRKDILS